MTDTIGSTRLPRAARLRRYTSIPAVIDVLQRKELPLLDPQAWDDRNDRHFMSLYKESGKLGGLYGLCAATCSETYHHWRVFTNAADGACIEIKREAFEEHLVELPGVTFGDIEYLTLDKIEKLGPEDRMRIPFVKRWGFRPEAEYRIIAETDDAQRPVLSIDFPIHLIHRIHLNPWLPDSIAQSLEASIQNISGCSKLRVTRSKLIDNKRWKAVADRVICRPEHQNAKLAKT